MTGTGLLPYLYEKGFSFTQEVHHGIRPMKLYPPPYVVRVYRGFISANEESHIVSFSLLRDVEFANSGVGELVS